MKLKNRAKLPPSQKKDLIGGHFKSFRGDPTGFLTRQAALGDVSYFRLGPQSGYLINHPDLIRDILIVNAHKFVKGRALQRAKSLLGEGLLTSEGAEHLKHRRMIQPAFHKARIAEYARHMVDLGEKCSSKWKNGETLDVDREMNRLTLQIVGKTLFDADVEDEADEIGKAMTTIISLFNFLLLPYSEWLEKIPLPYSRRYHSARETLNRVILQIIRERRDSGIDKGDLLSMLLQARDELDGSAMTDEQVRDESLTLFLAGHETTANLLTWTWYLLSQFPEKSAKLWEELDRVIGGKSPSFEKLPELKYAESVIAESMRLYPPAWTVGRLSIEDHELGGYLIPKGSLVLASEFVTHRDPRFWDEADTFVPERWERQSVKEATQKFIYFPFGGGVRRCIGDGFAWTEGVLLLATIARRWTFILETGQKIGLNPMITLRPKFGMCMSVISR